MSRSRATARALPAPIERWGIYQISDENVLYYPRYDSESRVHHKSRYFLVLSPVALCHNPDILHVNGFPFTTQESRVMEPWDLEFPGAVCGTSRDKCWLQVSQLQPMEKKYLLEGPGGRTGKLPPERHEEVLASLAHFLIIDE